MRYHLPLIKKKKPTLLERENRKETGIKRVYTEKKKKFGWRGEKERGAESDNK